MMFDRFEDFERSVPNGANSRGWLTLEDSQAWMDAVKTMPDNGTVVVIGVYAGAQLVVAKLVKPNATVIGIDPLDDEINATEWVGNGRHLKDVCYDNLRKAGVLNDVELIQQLSQEAGETWSRPIDLLLVDGDHREEMALLDLKLFGRHVKVGGVMAIDDMNAKSEVRLAYSRWVRREFETAGPFTWEAIRTTPDEGSDKLWLLRKTAFTKSSLTTVTVGNTLDGHPFRRIHG